MYEIFRISLSYLFRRNNLPNQTHYYIRPRHLWRRSLSKSSINNIKESAMKKSIKNQLLIDWATWTLLADSILQSQRHAMIQYHVGLIVLWCLGVPRYLTDSLLCHRKNPSWPALHAWLKLRDITYDLHSSNHSSILRNYAHCFRHTRGNGGCTASVMLWLDLRS